MLPICSLSSKENGCRPALLTVDLCSGSISDQICANRYEGWTELRAGRRRHAAFFSPLQTTGLAGGNTTSGLCYRPPAVLRRPILTPQSSGVSELQGPVSNLSCVCVCVFRSLLTEILTESALMLPQSSWSIFDIPGSLIRSGTGQSCSVSRAGPSRGPGHWPGGDPGFTPATSSVPRRPG